MKFRRLGRTGLQVSAISYGSWISSTEGMAYEMACAALDAGITTFDTADMYGSTRAETILGAALKRVRRESVEISTKVWARVGPGPNDRGLSRKHIMEACAGSLRRLQVDHIDIYQAHRYDPGVPLEETLLAFDDLVRQGKVLYVGVSEWTAPQIADALRIADRLGLRRIVSNQPQYSMLWRVPEADVQPLCVREGLGQMVWSPLCQGLLTGKYRPGAPLPAGSRAAGPAADKFAAGGLDRAVLSAIAELGKVAADCGVTMTQLALAWVLHNPHVSSTIVGASTPAQLAECAEASGITLNDDVFAQVEAIIGPFAERDPALIPSEPQDYRLRQGGTR
jgi:aryl-alcohol dehydrogenase-like predicted oxidoreductase